MDRIKEWIADNEIAAGVLGAFIGFVGLFYGSIFLTIWLLGVMK